MPRKPNNRIAAILAAGLFVAACGGGGGSGGGGSVAPPTTPPPTGGGGSGGGGGGGGGGSGGGGAPPTDPVLSIDTSMDASRFLARTTFGGTKTDIAALTGTDPADWLAAEFAKPASLTLPDLLAEPRDSEGELPGGRINTLYWDHIVSSNDQLRQRMAFALSQILVYSDAADSDQPRRGFYQDILIRNAFGNFRDLLDDVTYSPAMGEWLTYLANRKGDPNSGRMPDENYAREILQLFSIGLVELNMDGTPRLNAQGQQIETYSNEDIEGLARVFTGLS